MRWFRKTLSKTESSRRCKNSALMKISEEKLTMGKKLKRYDIYLDEE
jgi:hypothetical protein